MNNMNGQQQGKSPWPWVIGGTVVLAAGVGLVYLLTKDKANPTAQAEADKARADADAATADERTARLLGLAAAINAFQAGDRSRVRIANVGSPGDITTPQQNAANSGPNSATGTRLANGPGINVNAA